MLLQEDNHKISKLLNFFIVNSKFLFEETKPLSWQLAFCKNFVDYVVQYVYLIQKFLFESTCKT